MGNGRILHNVELDFPEYLRDESRRTGWAESISFPSSSEELRDHLAYAAGRGLPVTIQGGRTGITGAAAPEGGHIANLSQMRKAVQLETGRPPTVTVPPGLPFVELRSIVRDETKGSFFFAPDPTETSATLGGMIACNASGARSFFYGPTRRYVRSIRVMFADGATACLTRGLQRSRGRCFELSTDSGRTIYGELPTYQMPSAKNAAGYYVLEDMDLLDLFIGGEGTLGVIYEAELLLTRTPPLQSGCLAFLPEEQSAVTLVQNLRGLAGVLSRAVALEFFDRNALNLVRNETTRGGIDVPDLTSAAVYIEYHAESDRVLDDQMVEIAAELEEGPRSRGCGDNRARRARP